MPLGKQAKALTKAQIEAVLGYLAKTRNPARNRLIFLLSAKAGLRAKEIARLTWWMTNDSQGEIGRTICLQDSAKPPCAPPLMIRTPCVWASARPSARRKKC